MGFLHFVGFHIRAQYPLPALEYGGTSCGLYKQVQFHTGVWVTHYSGIADYNVLMQRIDLCIFQYTDLENVESYFYANLDPARRHWHLRIKTLLLLFVFHRKFIKSLFTQIDNIRLFIYHHRRTLHNPKNVRVMLFHWFKKVPTFHERS